MINIKFQKTKSSNLSFMTTTDNSEKETEGVERFYKINKENDFTRFIFTSYQKEIDGIYNHHKNINLNIKKEILESNESIDFFYNIRKKNIKRN